MMDDGIAGMDKNKGIPIDELRDRARRIRLLATDLDGTLFDRSHSLPDENREALAALAEKGVILVAATGRSRTSIPEMLTSLPGIKYLITANGARIYDNTTGDLIYEKYLSVNALEYVHPLLQDKEVMCEAFWDGAPHVEESRYSDARDYGIPRWFSDYFFSTRIPLAGFEAAVHENRHIIENINFVFGREDVQERLRLFLEKRVDLYELTSSFPFNYEIGGVGVSKAAAVAFIVEREGVTADETICFGDNDNDVSMVEYAGIGVAVANAVPRALAAAGFVTGSSEEAGVASALKTLGLI
ncbi:MAG: Cof-type HAD-IIB family hydrolase [Clostridiales bacterium]|nr:Cof-type HAD-IIB family hydrolase [Clostridiales bacterium]